MHRQTYPEIGVGFIRFKGCRRRAILFHGVDDLRNACGAAFCEFQFLPELANASVAVAARLGTTSPELFQADGSIRSGITQQEVRRGRPYFSNFSSFTGEPQGS